MELRMGAISYAKFLAKNKRDHMKVLLKKQVDLDNKVAEDPSDEVIEELEINKNEIERYNEEKARGAWLRSKANWIEYGEKNSNFFLKLENRNRQVKNITTLMDEHDNTIVGQDEILEAERTYYENLYTQPPDNDKNNREATRDFFMSENIPKLAVEHRALCENEILIEEVGRALKDLKNGKTPGTDGLPPDYYKLFWKSLHELVFDSLNHILKKGEMSIDQRRGVINLIPKKDKDIRLLKNWRPISLLNTDYKF
jgi:hypothetical protein